MKIRLDETLKNDFRNVCDAMDITASQRIRQMMKSWVDEMKLEGVVPVKKRQWSEAILRRRV